MTVTEETMAQETPEETSKKRELTDEEKKKILKEAQRFSNVAGKVMGAQFDLKQAQERRNKAFEAFQTTVAEADEEYMQERNLIELEAKEKIAAAEKKMMQRVNDAKANYGTANAELKKKAAEYVKARQRLMDRMPPLEELAPPKSDSSEPQTHPASTPETPLSKSAST